MIDFALLLPEITLAIGAMVLLLVGVYRKNAGMRLSAFLAAGLFLVTMVMVGFGPAERTVSLDGLFVLDAFASFTKLLTLAAAALTLIMSLAWFKDQGLSRHEYPVLIVLATLGMLMMISANDLMTLYIGLELQSLALYVVASFNRDSVKSTEAGLKYFVLGALSSGMLLYGCSLVYGFTGTTNFDAIGVAFAASSGSSSLGFIIGMTFIAAGLAFKISAVPFHMWTPDVYEGAPTPVTAFFAAAPKIAGVALLIRVLMGPMAGAMEDWQQIVIFMSIASMVLGAFAAIGQTNIKRLMAYSSIGHVGYALVGLSTGTVEGVEAVLIYMAIYLAMNIGAFGCILAMKVPEGYFENISDLAGLARTRPQLATAFAILLFSLAGIPPLAGFFGKFYVFMAAVDAGLYTLAVVGVLASVVGAYYYVRIIKIMFIDDPIIESVVPLPRELRLIVGASALFTLVFFIYPAPLLRIADIAAASLF